MNDDPKTGTTLTQLANSLKAARDMETLRVVGILRRYPARSLETREAVSTLERQIMEGRKP